MREVITRKGRWANGEQSIVGEGGGKSLENGSGRKMNVRRDRSKGRDKGRNTNAVN